ncbi:fasciclin domain-containing protein [Phormidium tenue FACHB-886]|nr:fasciclin domain-containing protein [Phormidium tenue FACHB-886]
MANLVETTAKAGEFSTLVRALEAAELLDFLSSPGPFTVLAPTDEAFAQLPKGTLDSLLQQVPTLKRVLMYHILAGEVLAENLAELDEAPTEEGSVVAVSRSNGTIQINDAQVTRLDVLADNGVIHTINQVLIPGIIEDNL